jgi:ABC-type hemin transport system ATPase subunit
MSGSVFSLRDLIVARGGRPVVHGVSLEIPPGEVTALPGPTAQLSPALCSPSAACYVRRAVR